MQPSKPSQGLERFAEAHVIREDAAESIGRKIGKEMKSCFLIGPQGGGDGFGDRWRDAGLDLAGAPPEHGGI